MNVKEEKEYDSTNVWRKSRYDAGVSQEYLANYVGVSRKTIQNWESGVSAPDINQGAKWFEGLGMNPLPYFLSFVYPDYFEGISPKSSDKDIDKALNELINDLPIEAKRELLFLFYGGHGSSPRAVLDLITAHLHLPMSERVAIASAIINSYDMAEATGKEVCAENIKPNVGFVKSAIEAAKSAAINGKTGYYL